MAHVSSQPRHSPPVPTDPDPPRAQVVWVGGLGPPGAVTERMIEDKMRPFGRIESVDIRRRLKFNDAFAFVVFEVGAFSLI